MQKNSSNIKNYTRGGQIVLHNIRMFLQITNKVTLIAFTVFVAITICIMYCLVSNYEFYLLGKFLLAKCLSFIELDHTTNFILPDGRSREVTYLGFPNLAFVKLVMKDVVQKLLKSMLVGLLGVLVTIFILSYWLKKRGETQTEDSLKKGDRLLSKNETAKLIIKQGQQSDLSLGGLPLIKDKETSHILFHGTVGSGKSNGIKELLEQIRNRGDRAIIYDKGCNFLEEFYLPNFDILLNPMDVRGESWHLWKECRDSADFDSLAAAQIPMPLSTQDPFWVNAARTIFSAAAFEMRHDPNRDIIKLLKYLLTADLHKLQAYLKGTVAETLVSEKIEKTAISIKSVLATYLKSLKYIKDDGELSFSIREWVQTDTKNNWLFVTSLGDRHETLKPLITSWLDIAVNAILSLPPDFNRRIWIILDEITSLQQLPYLTAVLSESRKFGGCAVIGLQNYAQFAKLYGTEGAREISSLINTRVIFRQPDPNIAKWSADNFGESVIEEVREGISYGANSIRDGISINRVEARKPVISFSEIMALGDLNAYVRLPGNFPISHVDFSFKYREKKNAGFILRHFDEKTMKEVDELIDQSEKDPNVKGKKNKIKKDNQLENPYDQETNREEDTSNGALDLFSLDV